jgi:ribosomal protein L7/L12
VTTLPPYLWVCVGVFIAVFIAVFIGQLASEKKAAVLRARGIYPARGQEKDEDVLKLLRAGEKIMAIRCYRSLHRVGLREAKDAVESLERENP